MIEYFTTRKLDDDMAELAMAEGFEWIQGHFLFYEGDIKYSFFAISKDLRGDDGLRELLSVKVDEEEEYHVEIISKKEFNPPKNFTPEKLVEDLQYLLVALTDFNFSEDGKTVYVNLEILDDEDSEEFLKKYFTKSDTDYSFKVK